MIISATLPSLQDMYPESNHDCERRQPPCTKSLQTPALWDRGASVPTPPDLQLLCSLSPIHSSLPPINSVVAATCFYMVYRLHIFSYLYFIKFANFKFCKSFLHLKLLLLQHVSKFYSLHILSHNCTLTYILWNIRSLNVASAFYNMPPCS